MELFQLNIVDLVIIATISLFVYEGIKHGFWVMLADFLAFLGSLLFSLRYYDFAAGIINDYFSLSHSLSNAANLT